MSPRPCAAPMFIVASRCSPTLKFPSELRGRDNVALLLLRRYRFHWRVPQVFPLVTTRMSQSRLVLPAGADDHMPHGVCFATLRLHAEDEMRFDHRSTDSVSKRRPSSMFEHHVSQSACLREWFVAATTFALGAVCCIVIYRLQGS